MTDSDPDHIIESLQAAVEKGDRDAIVARLDAVTTWFAHHLSSVLIVSASVGRWELVGFLLKKYGPGLMSWDALYWDFIIRESAIRVQFWRGWGATGVLDVECRATRQSPMKCRLGAWILITTLKRAPPLPEDDVRALAAGYVGAAELDLLCREPLPQDSFLLALPMVVDSVRLSERDRPAITQALLLWLIAAGASGRVEELAAYAEEKIDVDDLAAGILESLCVDGSRTWMNSRGLSEGFLVDAIRTGRVTPNVGAGGIKNLIAKGGWPTLAVTLLARAAPSMGRADADGLALAAVRRAVEDPGEVRHWTSLRLFRDGFRRALGRPDLRRFEPGARPWGAVARLGKRPVLFGLFGASHTLTAGAFCDLVVRLARGWLPRMPPFYEGAFVAKAAAARLALKAVDARRKKTDLCAAPQLCLDIRFLAGLVLDYL